MNRIRTVGVAALGASVLILTLGTGCRSTTSTALQTDAGRRYTLKQRFPIKTPLNRSQVTVAGSVETVHKAILAGLKDLGIVPITSRADKISATVDGFYADRMDLEITVEIVSAELSHLAIRSGVLNDRERSEMVFRAIERHLP